MGKGIQLQLPTKNEPPKRVGAISRARLTAPYLQVSSVEDRNTTSEQPTDPMSESLETTRPKETKLVYGGKPASDDENLPEQRPAIAESEEGQTLSDNTSRSQGIQKSQNVKLIRRRQPSATPKVQEEQGVVQAVQPTEGRSPSAEPNTRRVIPAQRVAKTPRRRPKDPATATKAPLPGRQDVIAAAALRTGHLTYRAAPNRSPPRRLRPRGPAPPSLIAMCAIPKPAHLRGT